MKNHSILLQILVFLLIFICFSITPMAVNTENVSQTAFSLWNFPYRQLLILIFFAFIFFISKDLKQENKFKGINFVFFSIIFPAIFTFCLLFFFSLVVKFVSTLVVLENYPEIQVLPPVELLQWVFCIFSFGFAAFNEEFLYRYFLAEGFIKIFTLKFPERVSVVLSEIITLLLFAFGHFYAGWFSVLNAALAHIVLRICYKKSKNIWAGTLAHFLYNVLNILLYMIEL